MQPRRIEPGPGQESVWDYPRPPRIEAVDRHLEVCARTPSGALVVVAATDRGRRVLETSQAPAYYFPPEDVDGSLLRPSRTATYCEWKGSAAYVDLVLTDSAGTRTIADAAWTYPAPTPAFRDITGWFAFYAARVERCRVGNAEVSPNDGDFYGGWITPDVVGPFKGGPGTRGW